MSNFIYNEKFYVIKFDFFSININITIVRSLTGLQLSNSLVVQYRKRI